MKLVGRTVLITGASSGIGEAIARAAHARGATVLLVARSETKLKDLSAELGIVPPPGSIGSKIMSKVQHIRARRLRERASCPACGYSKHHHH